MSADNKIKTNIQILTLNLSFDALSKWHDPDIRCEICGATFAQRNGLKLHIQGIHEGNKPHSCKICDYSTTQRSTLKQHIQTTHVEGKDGKL